MQISARRPRRSAPQIPELFDAIGSTGLSQAAFSRQPGIAQSLLSRHLKKKARPQSTDSVPNPSRFLDVALSQPHAELTGYRITFPSGLLLEVPRHFQPVELSFLLQVVAGAGIQPQPL